jgi:hypothetical protein
MSQWLGASLSTGSQYSSWLRYILTLRLLRAFFCTTPTHLLPLPHPAIEVQVRPVHAPRPRFVWSPHVASPLPRLFSRINVDKERTV